MKRFSVNCFHSLELQVASTLSFERASCYFRRHGSSVSSHRWKLRQSKDPFVELAKERGFRCRSAFKLLELNDKFHLLTPNRPAGTSKTDLLVLDVGAAPGAWSQVAASVICNKQDEKTVQFQPGCRGVVAVDLLDIEPIAGVHVMSGFDIMKQNTSDQIALLTQNKKFDVILSDMAPNASGIAGLDADRLLEMNSHLYHKIALLQLARGGSLVLKFWQTPELKEFSTKLKEKFELVKTFKPKSSRKDSSEIYVIAKKFK
ncbi:ribosomal RNA large subunit methyltransferase E-like isoform X2 [Symsagittifera roscoffensis]|uniref:ribosomal RNA large subunit methyltransferase E-like isoform X2 n=1 Tax=Symsagittifera roscoffensis TaxID=84072 RepID=UPI00307C47EC